MSRIQLALNVDDVRAATELCAKLFGVPPAKTRPGYANFAIADPPLKLILVENPGQGGTLSHLGVEAAAADDADTGQQLLDAGPSAAEERETTCCYVTQDRLRVGGTRGGERWGFCAVPADGPSLPAPDMPPMTTSAPGGSADLAQLRRLETRGGWTHRERLRFLWYRLRLTVKEINYATRRVAELQMRRP